MPVEPIPLQRRKSEAPSPVQEVHIVWLTAGLSCDGDSVSVTNAEQPSIEDVVLGAIPGLPKVYLHNPVLAYEVGKMKPATEAAGAWIPLLLQYLADA